MDFSHEAYQVQIALTQMAWDISSAFTAPNVVYKPTLTKDGTMFCALYGNNLQEGIAGFGDTPAKAMEAFDKEWYGRK